MRRRRIDRDDRRQTPGPKRAAVRYTRRMSKTQLFVANVNALVASGDLSVSEIARRAGIERSHLSRVLSGNGGCTIEWAEKISKAVGLPLEDMLAGPVEAAQSRS